jgi:hypothetical protein
MPTFLEQESVSATEILGGKVLARIVRHLETEVLIEFTDGTRLFIDRTDRGVGLSITATEL